MKLWTMQIPKNKKGNDSDDMKSVSNKNRDYKSELNLALRALANDKLALVAAAVVLIFIILSIFAPVISPYDPNVADTDAGRLAPVGSSGHILGTDTQGRDILSRLLWGGRVSIPIAIIPIVISLIISVILGILAAYTGGFFRELIMRSLDVLFAFPMVMLAVALATIMGPGMISVMTSITVVLIPFMTRVVFTEAMAVRKMEYIEAARSCGTGTIRMLFSEFLPNVMPPAIVFATTCIGGMIVFAAGLTFLGLGVQPPTADWGVMCSDGKIVMLEAPHLSLIAGLTIVIISMAFNLLGDGIRDAMDPIVRRGRS